MPTARKLIADELRRHGLEVRRTVAERRRRLFAQFRIEHVIDVGAATGEFGLELRRNRFVGKIDSFEPLPAAFKLLQENASRDTQWQAHNLALSDTEGRLSINVAGNSDSSSFNRMLARHTEVAPHSGNVEVMDVSVSTLDLLLPSLVGHGRVFLKLDVQGHENSVLSGAANIVPGMSGLQLETSLAPLYADAWSLPDTVKWADQQGFTLMGFEHGLFDQQTGQLLQGDLIFFREDPAS